MHLLPTRLFAAAEAVGPAPTLGCLDAVPLIPLSRSPASSSARCSGAGCRPRSGAPRPARAAGRGDRDLGHRDGRRGAGPHRHAEPFGEHGAATIKLWDWIPAGQPERRAWASTSTP